MAARAGPLHVTRVPTGISLSALAGYAIGTAQIVVLEWLRNRSTHRRQLRALRAEVRRALPSTRRYELGKRLPETDHIPKPPKFSSRYVDTVTAIDFALTDEHLEDNTHESLLAAVDACEILERYRGEIETLIEKIGSGEGDTEEDMQQLRMFASEYDQQVEILEHQLRDTDREIGRRLADARLWPQLRRILRPLRPGTNPPSLRPGDPRFLLKQPKAE